MSRPASSSHCNHAQRRARDAAAAAEIGDAGLATRPAAARAASARLSDRDESHSPKGIVAPFSGIRPSYQRGLQSLLKGSGAAPAAEASDAARRRAPSSRMSASNRALCRKVPAVLRQTRRDTIQTAISHLRAVAAEGPGPEREVNRDVAEHADRDARVEAVLDLVDVQPRRAARAAPANEKVDPECRGAGGAADLTHHLAYDNVQ